MNEPIRATEFPGANRNANTSGVETRDEKLLKAVKIVVNAATAEKRIYEKSLREEE
ncbi:MAG: hypothetical protein U0T82_02985 [Bacteroidales bacterium]